MVGAHGPLLQFAPAVLVAEGLPGPHDRGIEIEGVVAVEAEARAAVVGGVMGRHRVHQAADPTHHRNRAVAHGQQLADAAGLKAARHQEGIAAGIDQARQGVVIGEKHREATRIAGGHLPQARFDIAIAGAKHHKLAVGIGQHPLSHLEQQVHPLLVNEPAHQAHQVGAWVNSEPHPFLQGPLANRLAGEVIGGEISRQAGIAHRIPIVLVDTVENAA